MAYYKTYSSLILRTARTRRSHPGGEHRGRAGGTARPRHPAGARLRVAGQPARLPAADQRLRRPQVDAAVGNKEGEAAQPTDARPFRRERLRKRSAPVSGMWNMFNSPPPIWRSCARVHLNDCAAYVNLLSASYPSVTWSGIIKLKFK